MSGKPDPERNAEIVARRKAGVGPREIARQFGFSPSLVAGVLHRAGLTTEPQGRGFGLPHATVAEIRRRRAAGERGRDLAFEYGVDDTTISRIVNRSLCWATR